MLARQIERIRRAKKVDRLVVATSTDPADDGIAALCRDLEAECFRGDLHDVLDRFYQAARKSSPAAVIRLTGDCPLADPDIIDRAVDFFTEGGFDYASNTIVPTYPDGLDVEVMTFESLERAWRDAKLPSQREHVTPYINQNPSLFKLGNFVNAVDLSSLRWTVDVPNDFELISRVYREIYPVRPHFTMADVLSLMDRKPELKKLNPNIGRNEGLKASLRKDASLRYRLSEEFHDRASKVIPLGSQTFSKSKTQYPVGISPLFIQRGKGSRVWDVDGNEFVDFVNGLASVTLGYGDPDVTAAVEAQLQRGVIFSLPSPLEFEVAEKIVEMVPCAEMVRFGKNGSDATSAAIRLARAFTDRERVAVCGYHGWQDWYIGSTPRHRGVPRAVRELTHTFTYNDPSSLESLLRQYSGEFAAVILEPMNTTEPKDGFLEKVKALAHKYGAVLVFDETITGFRYAAGGAQEYFNVIPDLATFGKGIANGHPVSAVVGRKDIMMLMEEIFFSSTFGGELLSLAASLATLKKLQNEPVIATMKSRGEALGAGVRQRIEAHGIRDFLSLSGHPAWTFLNFKDSGAFTAMEIKTLFLQEVFARGILTIGTHNINYSHSEADIRTLLGVYDEVFPILKDAVMNGKLRDLLRAKPLENLFKIR